jgi:uncharacterized membrane protein YqjE
MTEPGTPRLPENGGRGSVGDLVSIAVRDLTRLIRCEVELAKLELRADIRRLGLAAVLLGIAAFACCLVLVLLCFAFAYGLMTLGIWGWAAFLIVAGLCVLLAAAAAGIVAAKMRRLSGLRRTRASVQHDLALLRRDEEGAAAATAPGAG